MASFARRRWRRNALRSCRSETVTAGPLAGRCRATMRAHTYTHEHAHTHGNKDGESGQHGTSSKTPANVAHLLRALAIKALSSALYTCLAPSGAMWQNKAGDTVVAAGGDQGGRGGGTNRCWAGAGAAWNRMLSTCGAWRRTAAAWSAPAPAPAAARLLNCPTRRGSKAPR